MGRWEGRGGGGGGGREEEEEEKEEKEEERERQRERYKRHHLQAVAGSFHNRTQLLYDCLRKI